VKPTVPAKGGAARVKIAAPKGGSAKGTAVKTAVSRPSPRLSHGEGAAAASAAVKALSESGSGHLGPPRRVGLSRSGLMSPH
jgi:hypothetical protein